MPELTAVKVPAGASIWPSRSKPQQTTAPLKRNPHVCSWPAAISANAPLGGCVLPVHESSPQQATVSSRRIAHVWLQPAVTALKAPVGGSACPSSF